MWGGRLPLNNEGQGLTGVLLHKDGNFLQVIEGDETAVAALFEKIRVDPRHAGIQPLLKGAIEKREFPDWSMAFRDLRDEALKDDPAFNSFLNDLLVGRALVARSSEAQRILASFRESMR